MCRDDETCEAKVDLEELWLALKSAACLGLKTACGPWRLSDGGRSRRSASAAGEVRLCCEKAGVGFEWSVGRCDEKVSVDEGKGRG